MKKVLSLVAVAGLIAAATTAFAGSIVDSKHNLSRNGGGLSSAATYANAGTGTTQICVYCHAPHNANLSLPLWNRSNPAAAGFTLYSGLNMANVSFETGFTADSTSLFCMSCHDGVTTMAAVHNAGAIERSNANAFKAIAISGNANLTTDLSKTHPINFPVVSNSQNDLNLDVGFMGPGVAPQTDTTFTSGAFTATFPLFKTTDATAGRTTANASLECGSCHAVHDSGYSPFLRDTMENSKLCLGCHNK